MKGIFGYDSPLMGALTAIGDCICLSVLWIVFSLPVVTIGASTTALYAAAYHAVRKKDCGAPSGGLSKRISGVPRCCGRWSLSCWPC